MTLPRQVAAAWAAPEEASLADEEARLVAWPWSTVAPRGSRLLSADAAREIADRVYQGTFKSPLQTAIYHYRKHARRATEPVPAVDEAALIAYIDAACRAARRWEGAQ